MHVAKLLRVSSVVGAVLSLSLTGCTLDSGGGESDDEAIGSVSQALTNGTAGFVFSTSLTGTVNAAPSTSYNSASGTNTITNLSTGVYRVDFPGIGSPGGNVQVSAFGAGNERCKVSDWISSGTTLQVTVRCFNSSGNPVNAFFTAQYERRTNTPGNEAAYVWAFDSLSPSYNAASGRAWNSTGGAITVGYTGSGFYNVTFNGQDMSGGTVQVTAYGTSNAYCKVVSWGSPTATVRCFNGAGQPTNSQFTLLFSSKIPNNSQSGSFVWGSDPFSASYTPPSPWSQGTIQLTGGPTNIVSTPATVTRSSLGRYRVRFPLMAATSPTPSSVKVTGYGSGSDTCKVENWGHLGGTSDGVADVKCFNAQGSVVDALYTVTYSSMASIVP